MAINSQYFGPPLNPKRLTVAPVPTRLSLRDKAVRVYDELRQVGLGWWSLMSSECRHLPKLLHDDEHVKAAVYGRYVNGGALLVATDRRVIFLDTMPLFSSADEVTYEVVSGVSYSRAVFLAYLTLHTRIGDYRLRLHGSQPARNFVAYIEKRCLEHGERDVRQWSI